MIKEQYISRDAVVKLLIKYRCKYAEQVNKKNLLYSVVDCQNINHSIIFNDKRDIIYSLFPPRKQWMSFSRPKDDKGKYKSINQIDRNKKALWFTYLKAKKDINTQEWYKKLIDFADNIVKKALSNEFTFRKPTVKAIEKDKTKIQDPIICRPICSFDLEDRLIASLYNKCLTDILDNMFYEKSFAFRKSLKGDNTFAHLKAVKVIKEFRLTHKNENLWVAECDMQSFYDTIDHNVIKNRFCLLLRDCLNKGIINDCEYLILKRVMFSYIDCFNFKNDVLIYNKLQSNNIWSPIKKGKKSSFRCTFKWIEESLVQKIKNRDLRRKYIRQLGVPQGGALSGLIANCMMHYVDMKLKKYWENNSDFCYIRFCDDMIMIGTSKDEVTNAFEDYKKAIDKSNLFRHPPKTTKTIKDFWNAKTREPYMWGKPDTNVFPWITFVGYDFNWEGDTRIRRKTFKKEIEKQYSKMIELQNILKKRDGTIAPIKKSMYIYRSLYMRLIGMSVGRFHLRNYQTADNNMSWAQAFTELTVNKWSKAQLRNLDRHRTFVMYQFKKFLEKHKEQFENVKSDGSPNPNPYFLGKPFSYYYQVFKSL